MIIILWIEWLGLSNYNSFKAEWQKMGGGGKYAKVVSIYIYSQTDHNFTKAVKTRLFDPRKYIHNHLS